MSEVTDAKPQSKTLEKLVAVTVVILSVFMAITKVKDDNIVQSMQSPRPCGRRRKTLQNMPPAPRRPWIARGYWKSPMRS